MAEYKENPGLGIWRKNLCVCEMVWKVKWLVRDKMVNVLCDRVLNADIWISRDRDDPSLGTRWPVTHLQGFGNWLSHFFHSESRARLSREKERRHENEFGLIFAFFFFFIRQIYASKITRARYSSRLSAAKTGEWTKMVRGIVRFETSRRNACQPHAGIELFVRQLIGDFFKHFSLSFIEATFNSSFLTILLHLVNRAKPSWTLKLQSGKILNSFLSLSFSFSLLRFVRIRIIRGVVYNRIHEIIMPF